MSGWIALSDRDRDAPPAPGDALLPVAALVIELDLPLAASAGVLLDWRGGSGEGCERALSVFIDIGAGVSVLVRRGAATVRQRLEGPLVLPGSGTARLTLGWNMPGGGWTLRLDLPGSGLPARATRGRGPQALTRADVADLCAGRGLRLRAAGVLWFGVTQDATLPDAAPWIGPATPVLTPRGPVAAARLRAGDSVDTTEGPRTLAAVGLAEVPSRGAFAPILLRAPYFGMTEDLLVSASQPVRLSGVAVEYLFAEDAVLAEAGHLTDGRSALYDLRRESMPAVTLDLGVVGDAALLLADGCALAPQGRQPLPLRLLRAYEAVPLMAQLGRGQRVRAA